MAVGVASVVVLAALGDAARRYVLTQFESIGATMLGVVPGKTQTTGGAAMMSITTHDLTLADADALARRVPGVRRMAPVVMGSDTVTHGDHRRQVGIVGTTATFAPLRRLRLERGQFLPPGDLRRGVAVAVLGANVARELFGSDDPLGRVVRIGSMRARVVGVLAAHGTQLGLDLNEVVVMPAARAMRLFNRRSLWRVLLDVHAHTDLATAKAAVVRIMRERHGEDDVTLITQDAMMSSFGNILRTLTLAVSAIAAISLAVAGLGIMNVMLVSVAERTSEVGLLRALGVGRAEIARVFVTEAVLLALAGGLGGLVIGLGGIGLLTLAYPALPTRPPWGAMAIAVSMASVVGVGFGWAPARRAARLDPVAALGNR